jgi:hypothetical protein
MPAEHFLRVFCLTRRPPCDLIRSNPQPSTPNHCTQSEVEEYFVTEGLKLNPIYHVRYWLGLTTTSPGSAAGFRWTDNITPSPSASGNYANWGVETSVFADATQFPEPNNRYGPETCAGADFLQRQAQVYSQGIDRFNGTSFSAWGWADNNCTRQLAYMCKFWPRETPARQEPLLQFTRTNPA